MVPRRPRFLDRAVAPGDDPTGSTEPRTQNPEPARTNPEPRTRTQNHANPEPEPSTQNPDTEWTRANLAEVLPEQMSPQVLGVYEDMLNRGQRMFMGRLLAPDDELGPMFKAFHGRMYMNLSQMRRVVLADRRAGGRHAAIARASGGDSPGR